ncbi:MAG: dephospho-CoA kinase, partial [Blautia massiliensis (ex Durand et al. 2017)]
PYETSVQRICARDGIAPEMARRRLDAQTPLETLRAAATEELVNDGSPAQLEDKIKAFLHSLRKEEYD